MNRMERRLGEWRVTWEVLVCEKHGVVSSWLNQILGLSSRVTLVYTIINIV